MVDEESLMNPPCGKREREMVCKLWKVGCWIDGLKKIWRNLQVFIDNYETSLQLTYPRLLVS